MSTLGLFGNDLTALIRKIVNEELTRPVKGLTPGIYNWGTVDASGRIRRASDAGGGIPTDNNARFFRTGSQSIADDGNFHTVVLNQDAFVGADIYSYDNTTGVITFDETGVYLVIARAVFASNATGMRWLAGLSDVSDVRTAINGDITTLECSGLFEQAASDTISIVVKQNSGGALNLVSNLTSVYIARIGL